ncbi:replicative DNA helicase [Streptomyces sp. NPDC092296]|uniref:replicative DNA helicase n=1 Tax=Streptomyces sp. NPDC092296 TaxID=3366012 RepID=UPI0038075D7F
MPGSPLPGGPGDRLPVPRNRRDGSGSGGRGDWKTDRGRDGGGHGGDAFERVPPQDLAAEQSVLGGMLLSKDAIADVVEVLKPADYYRPAHEMIHGAILDLYARGEPADPITVAGELTKRGEITRVGGPGYLHTLVNSVPTAANAEYYAEIVHERAVLRRLVEAGTRIAGMGYAAEGDVDEIVNAAQAEIYAVTEQRTSEDYAPLADIMEGALDEIEAIGSRSGQMSGVPTGFTDLDQLTNGLHPGQMVVIAARPAMGKCVTASTLLVDAATGERIAVADFVRRGQAGEPLRVHTLDADWKLRSVTPSDFIHNGRRAVLRLTTRLGRSIAATPNHPFRTLRGWVPLAELRAGDRIAVARDLPARSSARLPDAEVALTGYLLGGGCPPGAATLREDYGRWAEAAAALPVLDGGGRDACVPEVFFRLSERQLALFLSRLFAAGGRVSAPGERPQLEYGPLSERPAREVAQLLLRLGIVAELLPDPAPGRAGFRLLVRDPDQIRTFAARVGALGQETRLAELLDRVGGPAAVRPDLDLIPAEVWELIAAEGGHPDPYEGQPISRARLLEIAKALDSRPLRDLAESDVQWDRVETIVPDGEAEVYDLTVDGTHNFVADDIVVHNSTLALDFARACSIKNGMPSVIFSLEMGRNEIAMRLLSAEARVALHHMRSGNMTDDDWTRVARRMPDVTAAPLYIDDSPNLSMMEIRAKCRRLKQRNDLRLVVIDYLQLMQAGGSRRAESRQQEVSDMSRNLKLLAKELEVPVIALSQLNRGPEQRTDKKPMVSDLRESGSIEQDADMVILLHREDAYEKESPRAGEADLIVAKHRNGPTATITVAFQGHYSRFVDMANS